MNVPPPPPGALPPPPDQLSPPAPSRRRAWIVAAAVVVAGSLVIAVLMNRGGPWWPDRVAGFSRLRTDEARSFEEGVSTVHFGNVRLVGAMYGSSNDRMQLLIERMEGASADIDLIDLGPFFDSAASGFESGSHDVGIVDTESARTIWADGVYYECAPFTMSGTSSLFSGAPSGGVICAWKGSSIGLLVSFATSDLTAAFDEAQSVYAALQIPH